MMRKALITLACLAAVLGVGSSTAKTATSVQARTAYAQQTAVAAWKRHFLAAHPSARWPSGALAPTLPAVDTVKGNIFVAPNGNDSGSDCQRFSVKQVFPTTRSNVCLTIGKAYDIAQAGDKIIVGNGTYSADQTICRGTSWPSCSDSGDRSGPVITIQAETRHGALIVGNLFLGSGTGVSSPSYVTIDGIDVNGMLRTRSANSGTASKHVTLQNMHVWDLANTTAGYTALVGWFSGLVVGLTYNNMDIGPSCCNSDAIELAIGPIAYTVPVNVTYQNSQIHDVYDGCEDIPANITYLWGSCTGTNTGAHVDGFQLWGGFRNLKFLNNRFYALCNPGTSGCNGALFIQCGDPTDGSTLYECKNATIDHNIMVAGLPGTGRPTTAAFGTSASAADVLGMDGAWRLTNNTIINLDTLGDAVGFGAAGGDNGFEPTGTLYVANNDATTWLGYTGGQCIAYRVSGSSFQPTFARNLFGNHICDPQ